MIMNNFSPEFAHCKLKWSIIPTQGNKRPQFSWKEYQTRKPSDEEFDSWMGRNPPCWAVITGAISGIVVLDFDGPQGCDLVHKWNVKPHVQTPSGGYHLYLIHPGFSIQTLNSKSKRALGVKYPGLDIRGDGGYALFFGKTEKGKYQWLREPFPDPIEVIPYEVARFLNLLSEKSQEKKQTPTSIEYSSRCQMNPGKWLQWGLNRVRSLGGRNNACKTLADQLRDNGIPYTEAKSIILGYQASVPPTNARGEWEEFSEREALVCLDSSYNSPPRFPWNLKYREKESKEKSAGQLDTTDCEKKDCCESLPQAKPIILHNWQLRFALERIWLQIKKQNDAVIQSGHVMKNLEPLFLSGNHKLTRLVRLEKPDANNSIEIQIMSREQVYGLLARMFDWKTEGKDGALSNRDPKKKRCRFDLWRSHFCCFTWRV